MVILCSFVLPEIFHAMKIIQLVVLAFQNLLYNYISSLKRARVSLLTQLILYPFKCL